MTRAQPTTYLHRLLSDEIFHFYEGGPLDVLLLGPTGTGEVRRLGTDVAAGERPQIVIPAGTWFAAELARRRVALPHRLHRRAGVRVRRLRAGSRARAGGALPRARRADRAHDPAGLSYQ